MADIIRRIYKDMIKESPKTTEDNRIKLFRDRVKKAYSNTKSHIIVVDPITLQPIVSKASLPSEGYYKKFGKKTPIKIESMNKKDASIPKLFNKKVCSPGKVKSVLTGRCIKEKSVKVCPPGKVRNPFTGRCVKVKSSPKKVKKTKSKV